jgi:hypothetical protein
MKVEPRGKYGGVKIHLEPEECNKLMQAAENATKHGTPAPWIVVPLNLAIQMGKSVKELLESEPALLEDRTPEQVAAILAKEAEKAALQLNAVKSGKQWQKVNKDELQAALLKHVK